MCPREAAQGHSHSRQLQPQRSLSHLDAMVDVAMKTTPGYYEPKASCIGALPVWLLVFPVASEAVLATTYLEFEGESEEIFVDLEEGSPTQHI